jgi:hypothetical protein
MRSIDILSEFGNQFNISATEQPVEIFDLGNPRILLIELILREIERPQELNHCS